MHTLSAEVSKFARAKAEDERAARQMVAFRLATGFDLEAARQTVGPERAAVVVRLRRLVERERLRGAKRHWSYDLNRHIALKQALDSLTPDGPPQPLACEAIQRRALRRSQKKETAPRGAVKNPQP